MTSERSAVVPAIATILPIVLAVLACGSQPALAPLGPIETTRAGGRAGTRIVAATGGRVRPYRGVPGDETSLVVARDRALVAGLGWMRGFLQRDEHLQALGADGVLIFRELGATSVRADVRAQAEQAAEQLWRRLAGRWLAQRGPIGRAELVDALDLLGVSGDESDPLVQTLLQRARGAFTQLASAEQLYQIGLDRLPQADEDQLYDLLIDGYVVAKARARFPGRFGDDRALGRLLAFVSRRPHVSLTDRDGDDLFLDHAYLATHVAFVASDYGSLRLSERELPWVLPYLRRNFDALLGRQDVELVGEIVDVLRSFGYTEDSDDMVDRGTRWLVATQHADGSWGPWRDEQDPYDAIHYSWCAVGGLKARSFVRDTRYERRMRAVLAGLR